MKKERERWRRECNTNLRRGRKQEVRKWLGEEDDKKMKDKR